jgi:lipopolysaccharide export LptBFGC system permease protein LptF
MTLLDRHVALAFLRNYLISFLVLVGMYIVLDLVFNLDELMDAPAGALGMLWHMVDYYSYQCLLFFVHLSGMIPATAAAFTLVSMVRCNELSALLAAGMPLQRLAVPILVCGLGLNALLWIDQEYLIPNAIPQLVRKHGHLAADAASFQVQAMRDAVSGDLLIAGRYVPAVGQGPARMDHVSFLLLDADGRPRAHVKADAALWVEQGQYWELRGGAIDENLSPGPIRSRPADRFPLEPGAVCGFTPEEVQLYRSGNFVELLSLKRIEELLARPGSYGRADLLRVKHSRGVPRVLFNLTLLLLCLGTVLTRDPQELAGAIARCLLLCAGCLGLHFAGQYLAEAPAGLPAVMVDMWPALMAWLPVFVFGPVAVVLLARVRT